MINLFIRNLYKSSAPACSQYFLGLQLVQLALALHLLVSSFTHSRILHLLEYLPSHWPTYLFKRIT